MARCKGLRTTLLRVALAALTFAAPAAAETIEVRPDLALQGTAPFRTAVTALPGDTIRVELPGQAGSGYAWSATLEGAALVPGRTETGAAARPGGPVREILTWRAAAPGSARILLLYQRPWETSKPPARQVVLSVEVTPAPEPPVPEETP